MNIDKPYLEGNNLRKRVLLIAQAKNNGCFDEIKNSIKPISVFDHYSQIDILLGEMIKIEYLSPK
jgi:hypothetical protein